MKTKFGWIVLTLVSACGGDELCTIEAMPSGEYEIRNVEFSIHENTSGVLPFFAGSATSVTMAVNHERQKIVAYAKIGTEPVQQEFTIEKLTETK